MTPKPLTTLSRAAGAQATLLNGREHKSPLSYQVLETITPRIPRPMFGATVVCPPCYP